MNPETVKKYDDIFADRLAADKKHESISEDDFWFDLDEEDIEMVRAILHPSANVRQGFEDNPTGCNEMDGCDYIIMYGALEHRWNPMTRMTDLTNNFAITVSVDLWKSLIRILPEYKLDEIEILRYNCSGIGGEAPEYSWHGN